MKTKSFFKIAFMAVIIFAISSSESFAKSYRYERKYYVKKSYAASEGMIANIIGQYTDFEIVANSNSNEVYFVVDVEIKSNKESVVENVWDYVTIKHSMQSNRFDLRTEFRNKGVNNINIDIDCKLYLPANYIADITSQYGDIDLKAPTSKQLNLKLMYGDANIATNLTSAVIVAQYSDVEALNIGTLVANMQYGDLSMGVAQGIKGKVQYGDLSVAGVGDVVLELQYGDLEIDKLSGDFYGDIQYSDIEVGCTEYVRNFEAKMQYGNVEIEFLGFTPNISGEFSSSYSEIKGGNLEYVSDSVQRGYSSAFKGSIRSRNFSDSRDVLNFNIQASYSTIELD